MYIIDYMYLYTIQFVEIKFKNIFLCKLKNSVNLYFWSRKIIGHLHIMEYINNNHGNTVQYFGFKNFNAFFGVQPVCYISLLQTPQYCVDMCYNEGTFIRVLRMWIWKSFLISYSFKYSFDIHLNWSDLL